MGLIFNGNGDVIKAVDGSLTVEGLDFGGISNVNAGIGTFSGNLNVGGVLTYEDVKNVDSVGIVTARTGVKVTAGGVDINGDDNGSNNNRVRLGASQDLSLWHDGTNSYVANTGGDLFVQTGSAKAVYIRPNNGANGVICHPSGAVDLYHNNAKKLETASWGTQIHGVLATTSHVDINSDSGQLKLGASADLKIYHNGSASYIVDSGPGDLILRASDQLKIQETDNGENMAIFNKDGSVELYHNNVKKFETTADGIEVTGKIFPSSHIDMADNIKLLIGTGDDLEVFHNGSNTYISNTGVGNLMITGNNSDKIHIRAHASKQEIVCFPSAGVQLFYNDVKKFETTSSGATVTGDLISTSHLKNNTAGYGLHNTATNAYFYSQGSNETRLYHSANAQIKLSFRGSGNVLRGAVSADASGMHILTAGSSEQKGVRCITDGATELYHSGTKKCETQSFGLEVNGGKIEIKGTEGGEAQLLLAADEGDDTDDVWRFMAGTSNYFTIQNTHGGSWEYNARFVGGGSCYFYENNIQKLRTVSDGIQVEGEEGQHAIVTLVADEGDDAASDYWRLVAETDATFRIEQYNGSSWAKHLQVSNSWVNLESVEGNQGSATLKLKKNSAASNVQSTMITFEVGNQGRGKIVASSSDSGSPQFSSWSDRRLKTNFRNYTGGYDKIKAIPVKLYDEVRTGVTGVGWIADEFQTVFPEAVEGTKDAVDSDGNPEYQSITQGTIFPDVVQALQAAIAKIEVLEAEVAALKSA